MGRKNEIGQKLGQLTRPITEGGRAKWKCSLSFTNSKFRCVDGGKTQEPVTPA